MATFGGGVKVAAKVSASVGSPGVLYTVPSGCYLLFQGSVSGTNPLQIDGITCVYLASTLNTVAVVPGLAAGPGAVVSVGGSSGSGGSISGVLFTN
jgi:hypothetical protein